VRIEAIYALLESGEGNTVAGLSQVLLNDRNERVRAKAAWALGEFGCSEAVPALMIALDDKSEAVRGTVVASLEELDDTQAVPALAEALQTETSSKIRRQLIHTLGELDDERALEALHRAVSDADAGVRRAAKEVLEDFFHTHTATWSSNETERVDQETATAYVSSNEGLRLQIEGDLKLAISETFVERAKQALSEWHLDLGIDDTDMQALLANLGDQKPFTKQMRRLGFKDASDAELLAARLFGLDETYVSSIRDAGYCPSLKELVQLKFAGIDRAFLKKLEKEGRTELSIGELVALRHGGERATTSRTIEIEASLPPSPRQRIEEYGTSRGPNAGQYRQ
jgi:hypothetical protein